MAGRIQPTNTKNCFGTLFYFILFFCLVINYVMTQIDAKVTTYLRSHLLRILIPQYSQYSTGIAVLLHNEAMPQEQMFI